MSGDLHAARVAEQLQTQHYGRSLQIVAETASTMDDAHRAAEAGCVDGHTIVADTQRAGRGARGHHWSSPAGTDLYLSIVARVPLSLRAASVATLAVGNAVHDVITTALDPEANVDVSIKWPNDVWIDGKKCAGILVETHTRGDSLGAAIVGIGLNVNRQQWEPALADTATSIGQVCGQTLDRSAVLADLLLAVEGWVTRLVEHGPPAIIETLNTRLALRGERVRCDETLGLLRGVSGAGALQIETERGLVEKMAGQLTRAL